MCKTPRNQEKTISQKNSAATVAYNVESNSMVCMKLQSHADSHGVRDTVESAVCNVLDT